MIKQIGDMAGKIWHKLGDKGEMNMASLSRSVKSKNDVVYPALGWLARENKIQFRKKAGKQVVSLTPGEKVNYDLYCQTKENS